MRAIALLALLAAAGAACTQTTELLGASRAACSGQGPVVHIDGTDAEHCTGALAARFGRYALCSCRELNLTAGGLYVNVLGGPPPGPNPGGGPGPGAAAPRVLAASVGTDGDLRIGSETDPPGAMTEVAGSVIVGGDGRVTFVHGGHVQGNLRGAGSFATMTTMGVWVSGEMEAGGEVSGLFKVVGGPLRVPTGASIGPDVQSMGVVREPASVTPPCGCGATSALDLAGAIAERKTSGADTTLSFLEDVQAPQTLVLSCGEYYLSQLQTAAGAPITLRVRGRAAIFVAGSVRLGDNFYVELEDDAELDLVVGGAFEMRGRVFGSPMTPARTRLWVASATMLLPDFIQFGAAVYAPNAVLSGGPNLSFSGSLFLGAVLIDGNVRVSYDPDIAKGGESCGVQPPPRVD